MRCSVMPFKGAHRYPGAFVGDTPGTHLPPDFSPLQDSIALFAEAQATQLWLSYTIPMGPVAVGGHDQFGNIGSERYVRFMQWACWSPLFWPIDEGDINILFWLYKSPYLDALRQSYRLRGALVPYTYTLAWRAATDSLPFIRPMWWDSPQGGVDLAQARTQYFYGDVLVRPVAEWTGMAAAHGSNVSVWLPSPGHWTSWDGETHYVGPQNLSVHASLSETPLFVPSGVAIPLWPPGRRTVPPNARPTMWLLWAPSSSSSPSAGSGFLYQDDGESLEYRTTGGGGSVETRLNFTVSLSSLTVQIRASSTAAIGAGVVLQLRGFSALVPANVTANGTPLRLAAAPHDYGRPGIWQQSDINAEPACTAKSWVVVCPRLPTKELNISLHWKPKSQSAAHKTDDK